MPYDDTVQPYGFQSSSDSVSNYEHMYLEVHYNYSTTTFLTDEGLLGVSGRHRTQHINKSLTGFLLHFIESIKWSVDYMALLMKVSQVSVADTENSL